MQIIRYTVNACLVIVSYIEKHTTDRTEIANLESKVAFNFLPKGKHESGIGTGTSVRSRSRSCLRLNDSANVTEREVFQNQERAGGRWRGEREGFE